MIVTKGNYNVIWSYLTMTMIVFSWIFLLFSCQSVPVEVITESVEPKVSIEQDVPLAEEPLKPVNLLSIIKLKMLMKIRKSVLKM